MRLATKARIKRASVDAQKNTTIVDKRALSDLMQAYQSALNEIGGVLDAYADGVGILRYQVLNDARQQSLSVLSELERLQKTALFERMEEVSLLGVEPFAEMLGAKRVSDMADRSLKAAVDFFGKDGLQLSDRLWKINDHSRSIIESSITSAIVQGKSAQEAAEDFISRGASVPVSIQQRVQMAGAGSIKRALSSEMMTGEGSPLVNARRVFRTEINRAHIIAYRNSAFSVEGVVGTKFLLSPNHPEVDICDLHAKVNLYGLGAGVYPEGKSPLPAHPNTRSYEVSVFEDEVTDSDRAGRVSRVDFLKDQPPSVQAGMLGGIKKQRAFEAGLLKSNQITTPWAVLRRRLKKEGIDISDVSAIPASIAPIVPKPYVGNPFASRTNLPILDKTSLSGVLRRHTLRGIEFDGASRDNLQSIASAIDKVLGSFGFVIGRMGWITGRRFRNANGVYTHSPSQKHTPGNDSLSLKKTYVRQGAKGKPMEHQAYLNRRITHLKRYDRLIKEEPNPATRELLKSNRKLIESATRWSHSSMSSDPVFSTTAHESGHALYRQGAYMTERFHDRLLENGVVTSDWYAVSEYGATNESELFAEVTAFMASGDEHLLPHNVRKAYIETFKNYRRVSDG